MKIVPTEKHDEIEKLVRMNGGYCPCMVFRNDDTKCICKEFREQKTAGECRCGRFMKVEE